jgi:membrane-bound lytic murein transglycosylase A
MRGGAFAALLLLAGCAADPALDIPQATARIDAPTAAVPPPPPPPPRPEPVPQGWAGLPGWRQDKLHEAIPALLSQCRSSRLPATEPDAAIDRASLADAQWWRGLCSAAARLPPGNEAAARRLIQTRFQPMALTPPPETPPPLLTGYFEPVYPGCTEPGPGCATPLRARPPGLVDVDAGRFDAARAGTRIRGCVDRGALSACPPRAAIETGAMPNAPVLAWMDLVDKFFLQIQGSGRLLFADGSVLRLGYAVQNFNAYVPIGRLLLEQGELSRPVSMQSIRAWLQANPARVEAVLNANPSYVFFRALDLPADQGPIGSLGVPLTAGRSIAVDPAMLPLGLPVFIAAPGVAPRLTFAQDTGGAIKGFARADLFTGTGPQAGEVAGRLAAPVAAWVLLPVVPTPAPAQRQAPSP